MASGQSTPLPSITKQGITNLLADLETALGQINSSSASATLKLDAKTRIDSLSSILQNALAAPNDPLTTDQVAIWQPIIAPLFLGLTNDLVAAGLESDVGACMYVGGCIQCSETQCDDLGGTFLLGESCP